MTTSNLLPFSFFSSIFFSAADLLYGPASVRSDGKRKVASTELKVIVSIQRCTKLAKTLALGKL